VLRRRGRESPAEVTEQLEGARSTTGLPEESVLRQEEHRLLWQAIERLPERCARLMRLLGAQPAPSYAEIAVTLDMPLGSVGPTRARCLETLRLQLAR
jgi:RNA polymerase sigma factor (sigma-70 family)